MAAQVVCFAILITIVQINFEFPPSISILFQPEDFGKLIGDVCVCHELTGVEDQLTPFPNERLKRKDTKPSVLPI